MGEENGAPGQTTRTIQQAIDLGFEYHNAGRLPEAEGIYQQILQIEPNQPDILHYLGVIAYQVGKNDIAVDLIGKAIALVPDYAEAHNNLGLALRAQGNLDDAVTSYHKAMDIKPDFAEASNNLGNTLKDQGEMAEAVANYHRAITIKPDYAEAHYNLGSSLKEQGKLNEAIASYQKALTIKPDYADAHNNLGVLFQDQGKFDEAIVIHHKILTIKPDFAEAHYNLGNALKELVKLEDAVASYHKAIAIKPDFAEAHNNLGIAFKEQGKLDEAVASYQIALTIQPDYAEAHNNLGTTLKEQGKLDEAVASYHRALAIEPNKDGWYIRMALALPVILSSTEEMQSRRSQLIESIQELRNRPLSVDDPMVDVGVTNFYLAYHSQNNKCILECIARLHLSACPTLAYQANHCHPTHRRRPGRLRIGFLSSFLWGHTVGKLFKGVIEHFSNDQFEIIAIQPIHKKDEISEAIFQAVDKVVPLHKKLELDRERIAAEELDILFYLDIGMDPYTYFLSFSRLAAVQAVTIGHAESSGVPNIDYFISSALTEPVDADEHYSEQLIKLSLLPTYYYRPKASTQVFTRSEYGLPEDKRLYLYPQSLFKLHPGLDATLAEILRRDPDGLLVLISDYFGGYWGQLVRERLNRSFPDVIDRIEFVPYLSVNKFFGLAHLADAILDNPFLSGTNSGLEILGIGAPIVAWPGAYCSGNCVTACYRQMGLNDLIATDEQSFINLSLRLAQDRDFKRQMQAEIMANSHKLYERIEVVREMEAFFMQAYEASQGGTIVTNASFNRWNSSG